MLEANEHFSTFPSVAIVTYYLFTVLNGKVMRKVGVEVVGLGALKLTGFLREKMQLNNLTFQSLYTVRTLKEVLIFIFVLWNIYSVVEIYSTMSIRSSVLRQHILEDSTGPSITYEMQSTYHIYFWLSQIGLDFGIQNIWHFYKLNSLYSKRYNVLVISFFLSPTICSLKTAL